jgi:hypothetical protein
MREACPSFRRTQLAFAGYIRDPEGHPALADVEPARMKMYRELFFNNVESFIANGFPVLRAILDERRWRSLVHDFFARHRSRTPFFSGIPEEFLDYLQNERGESEEDPPFLLELAHYEWVELALDVAEGEAPQHDAALIDDPLACHVALSDLAWPLAYRFPVHRISRVFQPAEPPLEPTFLAVYRDREDQVRFLELNAVTYRLLQIVQQQGRCAAVECLGQIARELPHSNLDSVLTHGVGILRDLAERGVIGAV